MMWRAVHKAPHRVVLECERCRSLVEINDDLVPLVTYLRRHEASDCTHAGLVTKLLRGLYSLPFGKGEE